MKGEILHLLAVGTSLVCATVAQVTVPPGDQQAIVRAQYEGLNDRIYSAKQHPAAAEHEEVTSQLRTIVKDRIKALLSRSDNPEDLRKAIADVQGRLAFSSWGPDATNVPFAERFEIYGQPGLTVAFVIVRGGAAIPDTLPVLQFYTKEWGEWKLRAETDTDFHGCTFTVANLESPIPGQSWWLVWGQTIGDTGARRRVRLYSFDGESLKTLWARDGLSAGDISVGKDHRTILIDYYRNEGTPESPRPPLRIREEWFLAPDGPQQASSLVVGDAGSYRRRP